MPATIRNDRNPKKAGSDPFHNHGRKRGNEFLTYPPFPSAAGPTCNNPGDTVCISSSSSILTLSLRASPNIPRGAAIGIRFRFDARTACRLATCDTAGCQPAVRPECTAECHSAVSQTGSLQGLRSKHGDTDLIDATEELHELLRTRLRIYEETLAAHGMELPYSGPLTTKR